VCYVVTRRPVCRGSASQSQMQVAAPQADAYLESRDAALQQINSTIQELGGIFAQVAQMVQEQGELALRIDDNVDNVASHVEGAQTDGLL
jgi:syntaxin 5